MSAYDIISGSIAVAALLVALPAFFASRPSLDNGDGEDPGPYGPNRTFVWSIREQDGEWTYKVIERVTWGWTTPLEDIHLFGTASSRLKAERAVRQWFWARHKESVLPKIDASKTTGEVPR